MVGSTRRVTAILVDRTTAETLRHVRWSRGLSMNQCAEIMDIPLLEFLAKERGRIEFSRDEYRKLLEFLKVTETDLRRPAPALADV